ncbi:MAG: tetratricopeptide repeat protein [Desulfobacterales bacterium]|nr:tetratricopeptide repeat protein [Desulfobacterales bacterium]
MKTVFLKMAIVGMVIFFISGCTFARDILRAEKEPPVNIYQSDGRYYYYIESQIQQKKGHLDEAIDFLNKAIEIDPGAAFLKKELVVLYLQKKDHQKALEIIEGELYVDPNNVEALVIYGRIQQTVKQTDAAKETYQKILTLNPKLQNIYLFLGGIYMDENNLSAAREIYQRLLEHFPDSYVGHFFIGQIFARQGDAKAAEKEFQKTLELRPDLEGPKFELIDLYKTTGQTGDVIQLYNDILQQNPDQVRAAMELGYYFHQVGNFEEADVLFRSLGTRSSTDPEVVKTFAQLYLDQKKYDAAIVVIKGLLKEAEDSSDLQYAAGIAYDGKEDKEIALEHFLRVKPDSRFYQSAVVHISFLYQDMKKNDEGIRFLKEALKKQPDNPDLWMYLGSFYEELEDFSRAEQALQQALKIDPDSPKIYFRLGVVYDKWNRKDASIDAMKQVIRLDPQNANALNYLGYTYADLGRNLDEAEHLIKEALKYKPDDGYITDSLGWVYFKKGRIKEALLYLEKAVSLVPDDPIILEHLGDAYLKANQHDKALEYYQRSLLLRKKDKAEIEKKIRQLTTGEGR